VQYAILGKSFINMQIYYYYTTVLFSIVKFIDFKGQFLSFTFIGEFFSKFHSFKFSKNFKHLIYKIFFLN
jgi:hypothetical protein